MKCFKRFKRSLTDFVILFALYPMILSKALPEEIGFYLAFKWCLVLSVKESSQTPLKNPNGALIYDREKSFY